MQAAFQVIWPYLAAMSVLIVFSAFFSASEAALFYLRWPQRREMSSGTPAQQMAAKLLETPDRLLSAVLFWNLVVNIVYFALASIASLQLERQGVGDQTGAILLATASLLMMIFCSEMLPKSLAVLSAPWLAATVSFPLAISVRAVDPLMPLLTTINMLSRRLLWPGFVPENYMDVADLERAIEVSTDNKHLLQQEQMVLHNIVHLSDTRVEELMRPRTQFLSFRPPVSLKDLAGRITPSGYLLITEPDSEEIAGAIDLLALSHAPRKHLERHAEPVQCLPWCTSVADALEHMETLDREVAAVVNEYGDTIGILTYADVLDAVFNTNPDRSGRLLNRKSIEEVRPGVFHLTGLTSLKELSRHFERELPVHRNVTVAGVIQDSLQRIAAKEDTCLWGPFQFRVLEMPARGQMLVELTEPPPAEEEPE